MPADGTRPPTSPTSFAFEDATDILAPYIAKERRKEEAKRIHYETESAHLRGLSFHVEPPVFRTEAEIEAAAKRAYEAQEAFRKSAKGRLWRAISDLEELGYHEEAYRLRGIYDRSLSLCAVPPREALGALLVILNGINHSDAREGRDAIAEMLLQDPRAAA